MNKECYIPDSSKCFLYQMWRNASNRLLEQVIMIMIMIRNENYTLTL